MRNVLLTAALSLCLGLGPAHSKELGQPIGWDTLVDVAAQEFEDPYRDLTPEQLEDLIAIARLRSQLAQTTDAAEGHALIKERIAIKAAALTTAGLDVDWLIDQRWIVAERRRSAALSGNAALDGAKVSLAGFLIPAPPLEDGTPTAYLVPERGMCSHMPPPPPNQLLQLRVPEGYEATFLYTPVIVQGKIAMSESKRSVFVVDGPIPMWSAWTMHVETLEEMGRGTPFSNTPLANLKRK